MTMTHSDPPVAEGWVTAERHIIDSIGSLTMWEAEHWAAAHDRQLPQISLMAHRVAYLQVAGGSPESDYLELAFERIDHAVRTMGWATAGTADGAGSDRTLALGETLTAVAAVARHALAAVVLFDEDALTATRR